MKSVERPYRGYRKSVDMMSFLRHSCIAASLLIAMSCHHEEVLSTKISTATITTRVYNLRAFARLYGVVRWFHPSDAASAINWERFAIEGTHRVLDATDGRALRGALAELISPIAPTVQIASEEKFIADPVSVPATTVGLELVAWEHLGYGDS